MNLRSPFIRASLVALLALVTSMGITGSSRVVAQTPDASPEASQVAISGLPEGPLGVQIQWLLTAINLPANQSSDDPIENHFSDSFFNEIAPGDLAEIIGQIGVDAGPFTVKTNSIITTRDMPATVARFTLIGKDGVEVPVSISVDGETGLITSLFFELEGSGTPEATPVSDLVLPQGPLGVHIQWLIDSINGDPSTLTVEDVATHFTPEFLAEVPAEEVLQVLKEVQAVGPVSVLDNMIIMTLDYPSSASGFVLEGAHGEQFQTGVSIDPETGLIRAFSIEPIFVAAGTPVG